MILADRIVELRKKKGWSQEELAEAAGVTRQSVSKWESAQSTPDLDKILKLAEIFGVTTDHLLKGQEATVASDAAGAGSSDGRYAESDGRYVQSAGRYAESDNEEEQSRGREQDGETNGTTIGEANRKPDVEANGKPNRRERGIRQPKRVTLEEAKDFLKMKRETAPKIAFGVSLFILSPIILILLTGGAEYGLIAATEDKMAMLGAAVMLGVIAVGTAILVFEAIKNSKYEYVEKEPIELEPEAKDMINTLKEDYRTEFGRKIMLGVCLCVVSVIPLFVLGFIFGEEDGYHFVAAVCILLAMISFAVNIFVRAGIRNESYDKLLEVGDHTRADKDETLETISTVYWLAVTAVYLAYSLITFKWHISWVIWPVAGVVFVIVREICKAVKK